MSTTAEAPKKTAAERADEHAQKVASLLIEQLQKGTAPWQRPWELSTQSDVPTNATTGKPYRGTNYIYLWATQIEKDYTNDNRWLTFNQARSIGAAVKKGEHGTGICFPATHYEVQNRDEHGKPIIGADGTPEKIYVKYDTPRMKYYTVFHASQCDNMPPLPERKILPRWERHQRVEQILEASQAIIKHGGNRAYYMPGLDYIQLPDPKQFKSADRYYATSLHELGHWTGHADRLNRDGITGGHPFGSEGYAKEELRAEISSLMVGTELGIGHDPEQHAAYVAHWVSILQDDPKEILHAASDASKIHDYVMQYDLQHERDHEHSRETLSLQHVTSWEAGVMDAACIGNLPSGHSVETWGAGDNMGLAIRDNKTQGRVWLKDCTSEQWQQMVVAMRAGEPYEGTQSALVREDTKLDTRRDVDVTIGRATEGGVLVSLRPKDATHDGYAVVLDRDDAHRLANAMEIRDPLNRREYAQKLEQLRHENERNNVNEMEYAYER